MVMAVIKGILLFLLIEASILVSVAIILFVSAPPPESVRTTLHSSGVIRLYPGRTRDDWRFAAGPIYVLLGSPVPQTPRGARESAFGRVDAGGATETQVRRQFSGQCLSSFKTSLSD